MILQKKYKLTLFTIYNQDGNKIVSSGNKK